MRPPGFGGQSFIDSTLRKAEKVRKIIDAGVDTFVAGSVLFRQPDYEAVIDAMRAELAK